LLVAKLGRSVLRPYKVEGDWRFVGVQHCWTPVSRERSVKDSYFDGELHAGRHSTRLKHHDYAGGGIYFLTVCAYERRCIFGRIISNMLQLTPLGEIVRGCWMEIPEHFARVELHSLVVMPNHLHGIVGIERANGKRAVPVQLELASKPLVKSGSLGAIVRSFKATVTKRAHKECGWHGEIWQKNYFERVLRDGKELSDASRYIGENPMMWALDRDNPERTA
jgi:REP element-mobilizing transposase RayT